MQQKTQLELLDTVRNKVNGKKYCVWRLSSKRATITEYDNVDSTDIVVIRDITKGIKTYPKSDVEFELVNK